MEKKSNKEKANKKITDNLMIKYDSIINANEQYIVHQTNTKSKKAKGLSKSIFDEFPYSNEYKEDNSRKIGEVSIKGDGIKQRYIINLYGQINPGAPKSNDSYENRKKWFAQCLKKISKIENLSTIAFPYNIGCGLAKGKWEDYFDMIKNFAETRSDIFVSLYKLE
jgi:O-acetyl-ADP-ribose deacetylase (regulator of RNase III)